MLFKRKGLKEGERMLNTDNLYNFRSKSSRSIYLGQIEKGLLDKPMDDLDGVEQEDYSSLKEQMIWGKENGFNLVLTRDANLIDCWMIKDSSMNDLNPLFKRTILEVL